MSDKSQETPVSNAHEEEGNIYLGVPAPHTWTPEQVLTTYVSDDDIEKLVELLEETKGTEEYIPMQIEKYGYSPIFIPVGQYKLSINFFPDKTFRIGGQIDVIDQRREDSTLNLIGQRIQKKLISR